MHFFSSLFFLLIISYYYFIFLQLTSLLTYLQQQVANKLLSLQQVANKLLSHQQLANKVLSRKQIANKLFFHQQVTNKLYFHTFKNQPLDVFYKKDVFKSFAEFIGKHNSRFPGLIKLQAEACDFIKNETLAKVFSYEF